MIDLTAVVAAILTTAIIVTLYAIFLSEIRGPQ